MSREVSFLSLSNPINMIAIHPIINVSSDNRASHHRKLLSGVFQLSNKNKNASVIFSGAD